MVKPTYHGFAPDGNFYENPDMVPGALAPDCIWRIQPGQHLERRAPGPADPRAVAYVRADRISQLERRLNLAHVAIEAAQAVIGQCDCIMAEGPQDDPKRKWREARDAWLSTR